MDQELSRFSNVYDNATTLHPLGMVMLLAALIAIFAMRRDWIFLPIILLTTLVPPSQRLVVMELDFPFLRLAAVAGLLRIWVRGEWRPLHWTPLDKTVLAWVAAATVVRSVREFSGPTLVNALGVAFDTVGLYLLARFAIRDWRDLESLVRSFAVACIPVTIMAIEELRTGRNPFSIFPGVPEFLIIRDEASRLRGAYAHPILAGCYWVGPAVLYAGLLVQRRSGALLPLVGLLCAVFLIVASGSSTPVLGLGLAVIAALFWPLRHRMREVRWSLVAAAVVLQAAMGKPIWHLYQRVSVLGVGGSKGYHRYRLIDAFVNNFSDWAPLGIRTTASWGRQLEDVTNHIILQGVRGGLITFVLFIAIFVFAFAQVGALRAASAASPRRAAFAWSLGVAMFAHLAMMTAVSYFSQILVVFWVTVGAVASMTPASGPARARSAPRESPGAPIAPAGPEPVARPQTPLSSLWRGRSADRA